MTLNASDKRVIAQLEAMTLEQARRELASGTFGPPTSANHHFASQWLAVKEGEERDRRDAIAKDQTAHIHDRLVELKKPHWSLAPSFIVAVLAMLFAAIAAFPVIRSWFRPSPPAHTNSNFQSPQPHSGTTTGGIQQKR